MSADSRRLPASEREAVVKALYAEADRIGWEHLTPQARTAQYDKWVTDPDIGAVLSAYMSAENARSWIKDGPMKEYKRAKQGAGRYAKFGSPGGATIDGVILHAFGPQAEVVVGSEGVKPLHCRVKTPDGRKSYLAWGEATNFRYLVWACLNHLAENTDEAATIVITESMTNPTTSAVKEGHKAIAGLCGISLRYFRTGDRRVDNPRGEA